MDEIEHLKTTPVSPEELKKAQNQLETGFVFGQDSIFFQAMLLAQYQITVGWEKIKGYVPGIRAVKSADVMRVARTYFVPENRTTAILQPKDTDQPPSGEPVPPQQSAQPMHPQLKGGVYDCPLP